MPKLGRDTSTDRFTLRSGRRKGEPAVIRDKKTGKTLALKGYGALKDEYVVKKGINLSKPIATQAGKLKLRSAFRSSSRAKRSKG